MYVIAIAIKLNFHFRRLIEPPCLPFAAFQDIETSNKSFEISSRRVKQKYIPTAIFLERET
jgi:hypothetical protein